MEIHFSCCRFFVVEDHILNTTSGLVTRAYIDELWDMALGKVVAMLRTNSVRTQHHGASHGVFVLYQSVKISTVWLNRFTIFFNKWNRVAQCLFFRNSVNGYLVMCLFDPGGLRGPTVDVGAEKSDRVVQSYAQGELSHIIFLLFHRSSVILGL